MGLRVPARVHDGAGQPSGGPLQARQSDASERGEDTQHNRALDADAAHRAQGPS